MSLTKVTNSMIDGAVFNVLDYNATGDGSTNDSAAFQAALDAAGAQGGGIVFVPTPSVFYKLDTTIEIPNGVVLEGEGYIYNRTTNQKQIVYTGTGVAITTKAGFNDTDSSRNCGAKRLRVEVKGTGATAFQIVKGKSCVFEDLLALLKGEDNIGFHMKAERDGGTKLGCFYNYCEQIRILGNGKDNGHTGVLLSGASGDGQCNANDFYGIHVDSVSTAILFGHSFGNRIFGCTTEIVDYGILFDETASWNMVKGFYLEVVSDFAIQANANTEYNEVDCNLVTIGGGGGARFNLDGNRNTVFFEGRTESSGTLARRATAKLVSAGRPLSINQNVSGDVISGITNTGAPYLTFDSVQSVGSAGIEIDTTSYQIWRLNFTDTPSAGSITVPATDGIEGQRLLLQLSQDATGGHTVTQASFVSNFAFAGNSYTLGTGISERDILEFVRINEKWREVSRSQNIPS